MKLAALRTCIALSLLFFAVYGGTNWLTAYRADVGTWYMAWERGIPFVPLMIIPYMSIDLFFVAGAFICGTLLEMRTLARRISLAIVVSGMCFLLMPLRFAFVRPDADGWVGQFFDLFRQLDQPFNQFPSLHIALCVVLADLYLRHSRGVVRGLLLVWFCLIAVSTVLTYQHHVMDIVGGVMLAGYCFYVFPRAESLPVSRNLRIAAYYGVAAISVLLPACFFPPWGFLLVWPAVALSIMAAAYCGVGPGVFRKRDGALPVSARFVLGPVLLGHYLSLLFYRRQCRAWDEIVPGVWIGRRLSDAEAVEAVRGGVTAVLDLAPELAEAKPFRNCIYHHLPILDLSAPTDDQLWQAVRFISENAHRGIVYVHCKIGYSRSAAAVAAYLLAGAQVDTVDDAIARLRAARPGIIVRPEVIETLRVFQLGRKKESTSHVQDQSDGASRPAASSVV